MIEKGGYVYHCHLPKVIYVHSPMSILRVGARREPWAFQTLSLHRDNWVWSCTTTWSDGRCLRTPHHVRDSQSQRLFPASELTSAVPEEFSSTWLVPPLPSFQYLIEATEGALQSLLCILYLPGFLKCPYSFMVSRSTGSLQSWHNTHCAKS
jgi:hypothetical protein